MVLSYNFYTADGATTSFAITINYLLESHIHVFLDTTESFSPDWSIVGTNVVFAVAPASGLTVKIVRQTPRSLVDRIVDFQDSSVISESDLDTSAIQLLYIIQESFETDTTGSVGSDIDYIQYSDSLVGYDAETKKIVRLADPTSATDAVNKQYIDGQFLPIGTSDWDATSKKIQNVKDPAINQDAATKKYVDSIVTWGTAGSAEVYSFSTAIGTNTYTLTGLENVETNMVVLTQAGNILFPGTDFTITPGSPNSTIIFTVTPTAVDVVNIQNFGKKLFIPISSIADGSITTAKYADSSITSAKILDGTIAGADIADGAITKLKIAANAVDNSRMAPNAIGNTEMTNNAVGEAEIIDGEITYPKLKTTGFASAPSTSTDQFIAIDKTTGNQSRKQIASTDLTDFNSAVTAKRLDEFAAPTSSVSMGTQKIVSLVDPTANQDAATKKYVDDSLAGANNNRGPFVVAESTLGSAATSFEVTWSDTQFLRYEIVIENLKLASSSSDVAIRFREQSSNTVITSGYDYNYVEDDMTVLGSATRTADVSQSNAVIGKANNTQYFSADFTVSSIANIPMVRGSSSRDDANGKFWDFKAIAVGVAGDISGVTIITSGGNMNTTTKITIYGYTVL